MGLRCKELIVESPFTFIADNFSTFSAVNRFWDLLQQKASHYWLIAEIGTLLIIFLTCGGRLIPFIGSIAASLFHYQLIGFPLSVICSESPVELYKPHSIDLAAGNGFWQFKEQVPFKVKRKI
jgi:hypothetical protein